LQWFWGSTGSLMSTRRASVRPVLMDHTARLQIAAVANNDDGSTLIGTAVYILGPPLAYIHGLPLLRSRKG
jgi:hypothetical protein